MKPQARSLSTPISNSRERSSAFLDSSYTFKQLSQERGSPPPQIMTTFPIFPGQTQNSFPPYPDLFCFFFSSTKDPDRLSSGTVDSRRFPFYSGIFFFPSWSLVPLTIVLPVCFTFSPALAVFPQCVFASLADMQASVLLSRKSELKAIRDCDLAFPSASSLEKEVYKC